MLFTGAPSRPSRDPAEIQPTSNPGRTHDPLTPPPLPLPTAALPSLGAVPAVSLTLGNWPTGLLTGWSLADVVKYIVWPAYVEIAV